MGEYAELMLVYHAKCGRRVSAHSKKLPLIQCKKCGKECRGFTGLMQHENAKHETKYSWAEINKADLVYSRKDS